MNDQPQRRNLEFKSLDEIADDIRSLLEQGYKSAGKWNLAQACGHCNLWMSYSIDGYPKSPFPFGMIVWIMRHTIGKRQLQQIIDDGFKPGTPTMPATVPKPDAESDRDAVEQFLKTIERFKKHDGPFHASPLFGPMDRETVLQLQLRHASHHLGYLHHS